MDNHSRQSPHYSHESQRVQSMNISHELPLNQYDLNTLHDTHFLHNDHSIHSPYGDYALDMCWTAVVDAVGIRRGCDHGGCEVHGFHRLLHTHNHLAWYQDTDIDARRVFYQRMSLSQMDLTLQGEGYPILRQIYHLSCLAREPVDLRIWKSVGGGGEKNKCCWAYEIDLLRRLQCRKFGG